MPRRTSRPKAIKYNLGRSPASLKTGMAKKGVRSPASIKRDTKGRFARTGASIKVKLASEAGKAFGKTISKSLAKPAHKFGKVIGKTVKRVLSTYAPRARRSLHALVKAKGSGYSVNRVAHVGTTVRRGLLTAIKRHPQGVGSIFGTELRKAFKAYLRKA